MEMASSFVLDEMAESFGWSEAHDVSPLSAYQPYSFISAPESFKDVDPPSGFHTLTAPTDACNVEPANNGWELYHNRADLYPDYGMIPHQVFVPDIHPIQTVLPASIKDEPLSGISDASSIISSATTDSSPDRIHGWGPFPLTHQRKRSWSDSTSYFTVNPTRKRSTSEAFSTPQTISPAGPLYTDFLVPSSDLSVPEPADQYPQLHPTSPQSYSNRDSPTGLPEQFGISYNYSSVGFYNRHGQGCLPTEDVIGNGQTSITGGHFKAQVASLAVQKAAWKKRKDPYGRIFPCDLCGAQLTTKQNLSYHISAHLGERNYACSKCNKHFTTPHVRTRHQSRCRNQGAPNV